MNIKQKINFIWIICVLGGLGILGTVNSVRFAKSTAKIFFFGSNSSSEEQIIAQSLKERMAFVNFNGLMARILHQRILNDVIFDSEKNMFFVSSISRHFDEASELKAAQSTEIIYKVCQNLGIKFLYVQRPIKYPTEILPYGYFSSVDCEREKYRCMYCMENNIPCLDLRKKLGDKLEFYSTDHHWTVESAFWSARIIENTLGHLTDLIDESKYQRILYKKCFLGSYGIRVGKFFGNIDDVEFLIPEFDTSFEFQHYINHKLSLEKRGDFFNALIDYEILDNKKYYNKYDANLNGAYVESILKNYNIDSEKGEKLLLIADSFGRALVPYIAMNYREIRYLDPQLGRYTDNYIDYILNYKPDIVVVMTPVDINVGE